MKKIKLTHGFFATVSDKDYKRVSKFKWFTAKRRSGIYAARSKRRGKFSDTILMHRFIRNAKDGIQVDHRDRNGLNNVRSNIRICTQTQNNGNRISNKHSSAYKGVSFEKWTKRWESNIEINGKKKRLGRFKSEVEAARAYDEAAKKLFGRFSLTNNV